MPRSLSPEALALIPNGIENFVPCCIVCGLPVPLSRARGRSKDTCSKACHSIRQAYRKHVLITSKCLACYHPSTPEEREDFRKWRRSRGDVQAKGRPPILLRRALLEAIYVLEQYAAPEDEYMARCLANFRGVVTMNDNKPNGKVLDAQPEVY
jgi:hypothetical protein